MTTLRESNFKNRDLGRLALVIEIPDWYRRARCAEPDVDYRVFFPQTHLEARRRAWLVYCDECPVRDECAKAGVMEPAGIWGGKSWYNRDERRKERKKTVTPS